jgi:hypothetical protein
MMAFFSSPETYGCNECGKHIYHIRRIGASADQLATVGCCKIPVENRIV